MDIARDYKVFKKEESNPYQKLYMIIGIAAGVFLCAWSFFYILGTLKVFCFIAGTFLILFSIRMKVLDFDFKIIILTIAFFLISFHDAVFELPDETFKVAAPVIAYLLGQVLVGNEKDDMDKRITFYYIMLMSGAYIHAVWNFVGGYRQPDFSTEAWSEMLTDMFMARTAFEFDFLLTTGAVFFAILQLIKTKKKVYFLLLLMESVVLFLVIKVEGRYNLCILIGELVLFWLIWIISHLKNSSPKLKKVFCVSTGIIVLLVLALIVCFNKNIGGLKDLYMQSYFTGGGGVFHNVRFEIARQGFWIMLDNPNGGAVVCIMDQYNNAHNMWINYGLEFGVTVFLLLCLFVLFTIIDCVKLIIRKSDCATTYLLIGGYIAINVFLFLEAASSLADNAQQWLFALVLAGMIKQAGNH